MAEAQEEVADSPPPQSGLCGATSASSWSWGGLVQIAKDKSVSALEFMKKDIDEFKQTMQSDSESIATNVRSKLNQETAVAASEKVKHGMSAILGGIKSALIIPPDEMGDDQAEPITISTSEHIFDRAKARVHAIQIDPGTYCEEPSGCKTEFEAWKAVLDLEAKKGEISELLVSNVEVRALYTQMVPSTVSHSDFWQRYLYKMHQLDREDQRRADLMKRADVETKDDLAWDDEDDWENTDSSSPSHKVAPGSAPLPTKTKPEIHSTDNCAEDGPAMPSPTDMADSDPQEPSKDLTGETPSVVAAESPSEGSEDRLAAGSAVDGSQEDQAKAENLKTKEKGDLVVVGDQSSSARTSPASSDNSQNKESLDEDWEKDFDIEVTEQDLQQAQQEAKAVSLNAKDHDEDWESWE